MFPDVGSTSVPPGFREPSRSAASIIASAGRSLIDPPGFRYSTLATSGVRTSGARRESRTTGVSPITSRIDSWISLPEASPTAGAYDSERGRHRHLTDVTLSDVMVVQVEERPGAALSGSDLIGEAPPSQAGPVDDAEFDAPPPRRRPSRCRAPLQVLRFNQRQIEFVFGARRELGEVFRMRGIDPRRPGDHVATPTTSARCSRPSPSRRPRSPASRRCGRSSARTRC